MACRLTSDISKKDVHHYFASLQASSLRRHLKFTAEKSKRNATNFTLHPYKQAVWGNIWKCTAEKSQTNATNVTLHPYRQAIWGDIWKRTVKKFKQMQPMWLCILTDNQFEETSKNAQQKKSNNCNQCDFASYQVGHLRIHLKTHSGEKSNKCNQCDFASSQANSLRRHLKTHSGEKWNKCNQYDFFTVTIKWFEETFVNAHWRKVKQMQSMWLCILRG